MSTIRTSALFMILVIAVAACEAPSLLPYGGHVIRAAPMARAEAIPEAGAEPVPTPETTVAPPLDPVVVWAAGRFDEAGLTMPNVSVLMHDDRAGCLGHVAIYVGIEPVPEIHLCFDADAALLVRQRVTLHELAHVWTAQHLTDVERGAFIYLRGLDHWDEPARWYRRGAEHAAEIMAWGLLEKDIGVVTVAPNDPASLRVAFRFLTGVDPICAAEAAVVAPTGR